MTIAMMKSSQIRTANSSRLKISVDQQCLSYKQQHMLRFNVNLRYCSKAAAVASIVQFCIAGTPIIGSNLLPSTGTSSQQAASRACLVRECVSYLLTMSIYDGGQLAVSSLSNTFQSLCLFRSLFTIYYLFGTFIHFLWSDNGILSLAGRRQCPSLSHSHSRVADDG
jgi:hypothetical protein